MKNSITLTIPSDIAHFGLVKSVIKKLSKGIFASKEETKELVGAVKELVENAVVHAYKEHEGPIEISFYPFEYGIRIDVRDWGTPMSATKHLSVPVLEKRDEGFNRIYNLTDIFDYVNLGKEGKKFYLIKYSAKSLMQKEFMLQRLLFEEEDDRSQSKTSSHPVTGEILIREFKKGDEEAIARLIYQNYGHTYVKESFYFPMQILENEGKKYFSVIAETEGVLVGHFALLKSHDSNIAEIGIVVVNPAYKGEGIMNRMFEEIITIAGRIGLDALFGEAIMYHVYSQKSNLSHGFTESALQLGKIPADVALSGNDLNAKGKRGPVLVGFKLLKPQEKALFLPRRYEAMIRRTYAAEPLITLTPPSPESIKKTSRLGYQFDPVSNIAVIVINGYGEDFRAKFHMMLHHLQSKHCDMIYADINLEQIPEVDTVVEVLNRALFFYCGIHFLKHKNSDYLQLQYKHSNDVGKHNMVCYSTFCSELYAYIKDDEKGVRSSLAS